MSMGDRPVRRGPGQRSRGGEGARTAQTIEADTHIIGVSRRIWAAFAVLILALAAISFMMLRGQGEAGALREALRQARSQAEEQARALENALADKKDLIEELSEQGKIIAESSRGEEKAKTALEQVSSGAEATEKQLAALRARLAKAQKALAGERAARAKLEEEVIALQTALDGTRAELEKTKAELERLRAATTPYAPEPRAESGQGQ